MNKIIWFFFLEDFCFVLSVFFRNEVYKFVVISKIEVLIFVNMFNEGGIVFKYENNSLIFNFKKINLMLIDLW